MGELQGTARLRSREGKIEKLSARRYLHRIGSHRDSGTLQYDWFVSDHYSQCIAHERYRDSEAANLGGTMEALLKTCSTSG